MLKLLIEEEAAEETHQDEAILFAKVREFHQRYRFLFFGRTREAPSGTRLTAQPHALMSAR